MNKIKEVRTAAGISQNKLAALSNVPPNTIRNWEQGARIPRDVYQIQKLAAALNCTIYDLIDFADGEEK